MARHQEVTRLLQVGDLKAAEALCSRLTADFPQFYPGWHSASFIALYYAARPFRRASEAHWTERARH